jgi:hypothetical protein
MSMVRFATAKPEVEKLSAKNVVRRYALFFTSKSRISLDL